MPYAHVAFFDSFDACHVAISESQLPRTTGSQPSRLPLAHVQTSTVQGQRRLPSHSKTRYQCRNVKIGLFPRCLKL